MSRFSRSRIPARAALVSLVSAAWLWTGGLLVTPPPALSALALISAFAASLTAILTGAKSTRVAGTVGLAAVVVFLAALFHKPDGPVAISRSSSPSPSKELAASHEALRLVSFNVLHGYPARPPRDRDRRATLLADALRVLDPTVVVLQEAWSFTGHEALADRLGQELGFDVVYASANGSRRLIGFEEGSAVLSRLPVIAARRVELAPRRAPWRLRIALITTLALPGGEHLTVIGTHLSNSALAIAAGQSRDLAARLPSEGTVLVAGDINAGSDSDAVRAFLDADLIDTIPGGIDHVFFRSSAGAPETARWAVHEARWTLRPRDLRQLLGVAERISDHPGIVVDLVRRPPVDPL